jgi:hypothetical protein
VVILALQVQDLTTNLEISVRHVLLQTVHFATLALQVFKYVMDALLTISGIIKLQIQLVFQRMIVMPQVPTVL